MLTKHYGKFVNPLSPCAKSLGHGKKDDRLGAHPDAWQGPEARKNRSRPQMLRKVQQLRMRFHDAHFTLSSTSRDIVSMAGEKRGCVDSIEFRNGALRVQGWVQDCQLVTLGIGGLNRSASPVMSRVDVSQALGIEPQIGFDVILPLSAEHFTANPQAVLMFSCEDGQLSPVHIDFTPLWIARLKTDVAFVGAMGRAFPVGLRWLAKRAPRDRTRMLDLLAVKPIESQKTLKNELFTPLANRPVPDPQRITIILPVYGAFDLLEEVLERVEQNTDLPFHLIVIEDCSPDPRVRTYLRDRLKSMVDTSVTLIENAENLGFIGSVNLGLERALGGDQPPLPKDCKEGPIVLLNSDAFVPAGWASRLIAPMHKAAGVASVTPLSNDAEIMSIPILCQATDLKAGDVDRLDAAAARLNPLFATADVPTGVGFCMAMARPWLAKVPSLDPIFGRGYGEEVDWCQKVWDLGATHVAIGNLFVEHRGGSSFGSAEKRAMIAKNNGIVSSRYPNYDHDVQTFIREDPLLSPRLALAVKWAGLVADDAVPIYLAHTLGGGAESYLSNRLPQDISQLGAAIVLRVGGHLAWRIEVHTVEGILVGETDSTAFVKHLLGQLDRRHLIYSNAVGAADPEKIPAVLLGLFDPDVDQLTVLVHDYYMISPSYTLLGSDGQYRGPNIAGSSDTAHQFRNSAGRVGPIEEWQAKWSPLLHAANAIEVFSHNSGDILRDLWPDLDRKITVKPHVLPYEIAPVEVAQNPSQAVIGILGAINFAKGAAVIQEIAKQRPDQKIVVIGKVDPLFKMPPNVTIHGGYAPVDIPNLARHYGVTTWLIPSIWPETFSFTTHEALATGLPVITFDLGAQGDAARGAANGATLSFDHANPPNTGTLATSVIEHLAKDQRPALSL